MAKRKQVSVLTIDGVVYLGNLVVEDKGIQVNDALCLGNPSAVDKSHLVLYIEAENLNQLQKPIVIGGSGVSYSQSELSDDLALEFDILYLKLEQAIKLAPAKLVNAEFKKLAGA